MIRFRRPIIPFVAGLFSLLASPASAWQTAHGAPDNGGAADVPTIRAVSPRATVSLGEIAPGAGPVIAPDGTVYVGNMDGVLMAFRPDGTPFWSRDIGGFESIVSSPVLGSDGSVYVIGRTIVTVRDHTTDPATTRHTAELHRFTAGGGWLWHRPIPGATDEDIDAPPNILRAQGQDVILLPTGAGFQVFLTALSADTGAVLARQTVSSRVPSTSGGADWDDVACLLLACFSTGVAPPAPQHLLPAELKRPFPGVAVHVPSDGGPPLILMSDGLHDLMGFGFTGNGFAERFRIHDEKRVLTSTPNAWPDGHAMIATAAGDDRYEVVYAGVGVSTIRATTGQLTYAPPTALGGSRHAMVNMHGGVTFMSGVTKLRSVSLPGQSIAAAAASRNQVFVSTASALYTFDKATLKQLAEFSWSRGGVSQPVIGPQGHVYAIAADTLYVFPPPRVVTQVPDVGSVPVLQPTDASQPLPPPSGGKTSGGKISGSMPADRTMPQLGSAEVQQAETPPVDPQSMPQIEADLPTQTYKPPLTAGGNRLFACLELDGDQCGNTQMRAVAENFCQAQGFIRAEDLDVDSRRGVAETLDGRFCARKKCKVFDRIVCRK